MNTKLQKVCILDKCKFPETCRWNQCCMEKNLRLSLAAKKVRDNDTVSQDQELSEKNQKKFLRKPTG
ncbi:MAG: hypothetical protein EBY48_02275 [Opitutae bacterium]|nr:hypothetical protein [Opitutae bacterium]